MRLISNKMAMSILPKFLTLKWNISRTIWRIEVGDGSFCWIFHALSFELNFFFRPEVPFNTCSCYQEVGELVQQLMKGSGYTEKCGTNGSLEKSSTHTSALNEGTFLQAPEYKLEKVSQ